MSSDYLMQTQISIATQDGDVDIVACVVGTTGLAVHRRHGSIDFNDDDWVITHLRSGRRVAHGALSEGAAIAVVKELEPLADWDAEKPVFETHAQNEQAQALIVERGMMKGSNEE